MNKHCCSFGHAMIRLCSSIDVALYEQNGLDLLTRQHTKMSGLLIIWCLVTVF